MPENRLGRLAGRMKQEIEREETRRKQADEQRARAEAERKETESRVARRRAEAQKARRALLEDLAAFGSELGHVRVASDDEGVTLAYRGREVRFEIDGPEDRLALRIPGEVVPRNHHVARDEGEWEVVFDHGTVVNRYDLEQGLEELLRNHLLVPLPDPATPPPEAESSPKGRRKGRGGKVTPGSAVKELKGHLD
jgi:hypothetical protein